MKLRQIPSLIVALFLQVAPLLRTVEPAVAGVLQPVLMLIRWVSAAATVAGGAHALSGATGLVTAAQIQGTEGTPMNYRAQITSTVHGTAKSYTATGLPPGLTVTSRTIGIISGTPSLAGTYQASITGWENSNATGDSYTATAVFTIVTVPPTIMTPPDPLTVTEGESARFSVAASGPNLTYQWIQGDLELAHATNSVLVIDPVRRSDAGEYRVRVRNSGGALLTDPVLLTVIPLEHPPQITGITANQTVHPGENVTLSVTATAVGAVPTVFWTRNGQPMEGATGGFLNLPNITPSQGGAYQAVVSANNLSVTSNPVSVTVASELVVNSITTSAGEVVIVTPAINGRVYELQAASSPTAAEWQTVALRAATGDSVKLTEPISATGTRLFRVRVRP